MPLARHRPAADGRARAALALALAAPVLAAAPDAAADGEVSPVLGGALVGVRGPAPHAGLVGVQLETVWWRGRLGLGLEGGAHWSVDGGAGARATVLGASVRLRVHDQLFPSLLEPRDVELGVELHGIVERTWWSSDLVEDSPTGYGLGLALRLRGDADDFPALFTESRLFVRAVSTPRPELLAAARGMDPAGSDARELTILVGIGAAFGAGDPRYLDRFRLYPLELPSTR